MKLQKYFFTFFFALTFFSARVMCSEPVDVGGQIEALYLKMINYDFGLVSAAAGNDRTILFEGASGYNRRAIGDREFFSKNSDARKFLINIIRNIATNNPTEVARIIREQIAAEGEWCSREWRTFYDVESIAKNRLCNEESFRKAALEFVRLEKLQQTYQKYMQERAARVVATVSPSPAMAVSPASTHAIAGAAAEPQAALTPDSANLTTSQYGAASATADTTSPAMGAAKVAQSPAAPPAHVSVHTPQPDQRLLRIDQTDPESLVLSQQTSANASGSSRDPEIEYQVSSNLSKNKPWHRRWQLALIAGSSLVVASVLAGVAIVLFKKSSAPEETK